MVNPAGWDQRWVPALAAGAQRLVVRVRQGLDRGVGPDSLLGRGAREQPALTGSIAAVTAAAVVLAIAGGPGGPPATDSSSAPLPTPPAARLTQTLGPTPGASVPDYLRQAQASLQRFVGAANGRPGTAVIDLRSYLTPAAARGVFRDVQVLRAYVRAPGPGLPTQVHAVALPGTFTSLDAGIEANGRLAAATGHTFAVLVSQLHPRTAQDVKLRARYELQQRASAYEADKLQRPTTCGCVFAVVVQAPAAILTGLAHAPEVRVVDVASAGVQLDAVTVLPLEPEVTSVVPRGGLFGG